MNVRQLSVKVFARPGATVAQEQLIPIFHRWIQKDAVPGERPIDVVDYSHVPGGPGVMLICQRAHVALDEGQGAVGLKFERKRDQPGPLAHRLRDALRGALSFCEKLEGELSLNGKIRFDTGNILVRVLDRLHAPNTDETWAQAEPELRAVAASLLGDTVTVERTPDPKEALGAVLRADAPPSVKELLARL